MKQLLTPPPPVIKAGSWVTTHANDVPCGQGIALGRVMTLLLTMDPEQNLQISMLYVKLRGLPVSAGRPLVERRVDQVRLFPQQQFKEGPQS